MNKQEEESGGKSILNSGNGMKNRRFQADPGSPLRHEPWGSREKKKKKRQRIVCIQIHRGNPEAQELSHLKTSLSDGKMTGGEGGERKGHIMLGFMPTTDHSLRINDMLEKKKKKRKEGKGLRYTLSFVGGGEGEPH